MPSKLSYSVTLSFSIYLLIIECIRDFVQVCALFTVWTGVGA